MDSQYDQYDQYSWQSQSPPSNQFAQQPTTNPQSMVMDSHQYFSPQTQATTYSSTATTATTTHEQTSSSNAQYYDQSYIPQPQQTILASSQWSDQSHALQCQQPMQLQPATPQWHTTQSNTVHSDQSNALQCQPQVVQQQPAVPQWSTTQTNIVQQDVQHLNSSFAQLMQVAPQPQQSPAKEYAPLMLTSPAPQQSAVGDFAQKTQAAPPVPVTITARIAAPPAKATSSTVTTKTTQTTTTEKYEGANAGGKARKIAEEKGEVEVKRFEEKVQKLIRSIGVCPMDWPWYCDNDGYICAEGIHVLYHKDIDMAVKQPGWIPQVTWANTFDSPDADIEGIYHSWHPPDVDFWQPMHKTHRNFLRDARRRGMACAPHATLGGGSLGCEARGCLKGLPKRTPAAIKAVARAGGYNPDYGRHSMFGWD